MSALDNPESLRELQRIMAVAMEPFVGPHGAPMVHVPSGWQLQDLSHLNPAPMRPKGAIKVDTLESFLMIWGEESRPQSRIYLSGPPDTVLVAVFNDGNGENLGWRDHYCSYSLPLSDEWKEWTDNNIGLKPQVDFAHFVEKNLPDFVFPEGASMLELAQSLEANKSVAFKSGVRLQNGQHQLRYEETIEAKAGAKGDLAIPEMFKIGIPVFRGGGLYEVACRLRYRISGTSLLLGYEIDRPHKIIEHALKTLAAEVEKSTQRKIVYGIPAK